MPANRSRTLEWRRCLKQVFERNGALEIAIAQDGSQEINPQLVWRVRLLGLNDKEIVVEQPSALGQNIQIDHGIELVVVLCIGQNRWVFNTTNLGASSIALADRKPLSALRLAMPETVRRCQRRDHYRIETNALNLPQVEVWPLLDPKSVLIAERACLVQAELEANQSANASIADSDAPHFNDDLVMPEVGPKFTATLVNLGGGGVGLRVPANEGQVLAHHKLFWLRLALPTAMSTPICATGKLVHTHMESNHDTYAGMAFDFSFNPSHQHLVVDQICRYIALQQKAQHHVLPNEDTRRLTA